MPKRGVSLQMNLRDDIGSPIVTAHDPVAQSPLPRGPHPLRLLRPRGLRAYEFS